MKKRKNALIMSSAYLAISLLKQSIIPEMPLKYFYQIYLAELY